MPFDYWSKFTCPDNKIITEIPELMAQIIKISGTQFTAVEIAEQVQHERRHRLIRRTEPGEQFTITPNHG